MKQNLYLTLFVLYLIIVFASCNNELNNSEVNLENLKGFKCFGATSIPTPIRLAASGNVECFSIDGITCSTGFKTDHECREYVSTNKVKVLPVSCKDEEVKKAGHWCQKGNKFFYEKWHCPNKTGLNVAIKLNRNFELSCLTQDGKKCYENKDAQKYCEKANYCPDYKKKITKMKCTDENIRATLNNWCKTGFAYFRKDDNFYCADKLKTPYALKLSKNGNVQCLSNDGKTCLSNLNSFESCLDAQIKNTDAGAKSPTTISCGKQLLKLTDKTGYDTEGSWCREGLKFFRKPDGTKPHPHAKKIEKKVKENYEPKWLDKIVNKVSNSTMNATQMESIKKELIKNKVDIDFKKLEKDIKSGVAKTANGLASIKSNIKFNIPALRINIPKPSFRINLPTLQQPNWFNKLKDKISNPNKRIKMKPNEIKNTLIKHDIKLPEIQLNKLQADILSGKSINQTLQKIKSNTPSLRKIEEHNKNIKNIKTPDWINKVVEMFKKPEAKTPEGLKNIKEELKKNNVVLPPKKWEEVKKDIKSGNAQYSPSIANKIVSVIQTNAPAKSLIANNPNELYLDAKECGENKKIFQKLNKLLKSGKKDDPQHIKKVKDFIFKHFEIEEDKWTKIEKSIKEGKLRIADHLEKKHLKSSHDKHSNNSTLSSEDLNDFLDSFKTIKASKSSRKGNNKNEKKEKKKVKPNKLATNSTLLNNQTKSG